MTEAAAIPGTSAATPPVEKRPVPVKSKRRFSKKDFRQCRLCMRVVHRNNIWETDGMGLLDLRRKILYNVSVKISSYDKVQSVCTNCVTIVNMLDDFQASCQSADAMHRNHRTMMMHSDNWLSDENKEKLEACQRILKRNRVEIDQLLKLSGEGNPRFQEVTVEETRLEIKEEPIFAQVELLPTEDIVIKTEGEEESTDDDDSDPELSEQCGKALDPEEAKRQATARKQSSMIMCEMCGELQMKYYMEQHMNKHMGIRPYECTEENCSKRFYSSLVLKMHVNNRHLKEKQSYECETCHKSIKGGLQCYNWHLATHQTDNPLKVPCEVCGKKFYKRYLRDHMSVHTGATPYKCEFCNQKFAAKNNWQVHRRKRHADQLMDQG